MNSTNKKTKPSEQILDNLNEKKNSPISPIMRNIK